jgi:hypothetical protein
VPLVPPVEPPDDVPTELPPLVPPPDDVPALLPPPEEELAGTAQADAWQISPLGQALPQLPQFWAFADRVTQTWPLGEGQAVSPVGHERLPQEQLPSRQRQV